jgi:hypothetical protein
MLDPGRGWHAEITLFEKQGGALSKRIWLDPSGRVSSDGSACLMTQGTARRIEIADVRGYADLVNDCASNEALALGRLKDGLPQRVCVVTADKLNGGSEPATIARTKQFLVFEPGAGGLVLFDFDPKGMSAAVERRLRECGGLHGALVTVMPALETVGMIERASTSAGLRHSKTGVTFPHSGGKHIAIPVQDAADIPRFLSDFHARCWLAGFGWGMVSAAGSFLERSIVDRSCGSPERLIFEGAPVIEPPLAQDARPAVAHEGAVLDTRLCEPLSDAERRTLKELILAEEHRLLPERQAARYTWSLQHIQRLITRGVPEAEARRQVDHWIDRKELSGAFPLPFDDTKLFGTTVEQVIADPDRFINKTLADPHEGPSYGRGKAIIYRRRNGSLLVHSFAHGGVSYSLIKGAKSQGWQYHDDAATALTPMLIKGLLPETGAGLISGQWGTFKTTTALDLSVSVMSGAPFAGRFAVRRRGGVAYFAPEGSGGLKSRLNAIARERGVSGILPFAWRGDCPPLMAPDALEQLTRMATEASRHFKNEFDLELVLIFVDTVIAAAGYTKEGQDSDTAAAQMVMSRLSDLSKKTGALVLGVDHFGKVIETGTRGSSAKEGHADVVLALLGERQVGGAIGNTRLAIRKMRDGPSGMEIPFTPRDVPIGTDEDGEKITRAVLDWGEPGDAAAFEKPDAWPKSLQLLRRILMTMLVDLGVETTPFADGPTVRAVDIKPVRAEFYKQYPADGENEKKKTDARRQAFNRTIKDAQARSLIGSREVGGVQLIWLAKSPSPA